MAEEEKRGRQSTASEQQYNPHIDARMKLVLAFPDTLLFLAAYPDRIVYFKLERIHVRQQPTDENALSDGGETWKVPKDKVSFQKTNDLSTQR